MTIKYSVFKAWATYKEWILLFSLPRREVVAQDNVSMDRWLTPAGHFVNVFYIGETIESIE